MRRLADRLGSGVMSLYWHVDNKEDVFDLALDSVLEYRGPPQTAEPQDWRGEVVHMLEDWRASMLRHPWSASLLPRRALGPNILSRLELLSKTLSRAGVADADLNVAIWSLWNYVMGATITRASFDLSDDDRAAAQQRLDVSANATRRSNAPACCWMTIGMAPSGKASASCSMASLQDNER